MVYAAMLKKQSPVPVCVWVCMFFFCDAVCGFVVMLLLVLCKQAHGLARVDRYLEALLA